MVLVIYMCVQYIHVHVVQCIIRIAFHQGGGHIHVHINILIIIIIITMFYSILKQYQIHSYYTRLHVVIFQFLFHEFLELTMFFNIFIDRISLPHIITYTHTQYKLVIITTSCTLYIG